LLKFGSFSWFSAYAVSVIKTSESAEDRSKYDFCYSTVLGNTLCN
jgi:hypothetical protein